MYIPPMKRTQVYLPEETAEELAAVAAAEGRSAAAVVREAVADYIARRQPEPGENPILDLVGIGREGPTDAAEHHDRYLYSDHDDA